MGQEWMRRREAVGVEQLELGELEGTLGSWPIEVGKVGVEVGRVGRGLEVEEM